MNAHSASLNSHNLVDLFEIDFIWKQKHIILEMFWFLLKLIHTNSLLLNHFFLMKHFYDIGFFDRNIDSNEKLFLPFQVCGNDAVMTLTTKFRSLWLYYCDHCFVKEWFSSNWWTYHTHPIFIYNKLILLRSAKS